MEVLLAPVELRTGTRWTQLARRASDRGFAAALLSALTLLAVAIAGYHPCAEDGGLYLAGVKRLLDAGLYPHDTAFVLEPMRMSAFARVVAGLVRITHIGLPAMLLALHVASVWATLLAAWTLAGRCWSERRARAGAVTLLACWLGLPVAGTALFLMDPYLTARSFATPAMLFAIVGALDATEWRGASVDDARRRVRGWVLWTGSLVTAGMMHPLTAAYALGATLMLACVRALHPRVRIGGAAALSATALGVAACAQMMAAPETPEYVRVALTRSYWFLAEWHWYELIGLAAPLAILGAIAWGGKRTHVSESRGEATEDWALRAIARAAVITGATAWIVAAVFAREGSATHMVARMQPLRAFQMVYVVMVLALGAKLGELVLRRSVWRWAAAVLVLGGAMLGVAHASFPGSDHLELPWVAPRNPWTQAFLWVRGNTPKDALFALDADYVHAHGEDAQSFRAIAERSALPDYSKDGGEASIAPDLTTAWTAGQAAQQGLSAAITSTTGTTDLERTGMTDAERIARLRPFGVMWVVLDAGAATAFDCPYRNADVRVCRMP